MFARLISASALFHFVNVVAAGLMVRAWRKRYRGEPSDRPRMLRLFLDTNALGVLAGASAVFGGLSGGIGPFGVINLASQWIFGELLMLLGVAAWLLRRSGFKAVSSVAVISLVALICVFIDAHFIEPRSLEVHEHTVPPSGGRPGVTQASRELRIAHLSDIQTPAIGDHERRAFREALALKPDLVILTGDYIHSLPGIEDEEDARRDLRDLLNSLPPPRLGIYAVKGDTEGDAWPSMFDGTRVVTLTDRAVRVPLPDEPARSLSIVGLSPGVARGGNRNGLRRLVRSVPTDDYVVVFGHSPDYVMNLEPGTVDVALGGHTHGGQIALPFFGPPITLSRLPRKMARGLHDWNGTPIHVSAGVGMERHYAPQFRFLCRPEVCLLRTRN